MAMTGYLTIRNLTPIPLFLTNLERMVASKADSEPRHGNKNDSLSGSLTRLMRNVVTGVGNKTQASTSENEYSSDSQEVMFELPPCGTTRTSLKSPPPAQLTRLTFQDHDGKQWYINIPTPSSHYTTLAKSSQTQVQNFSALYNIQSRVLVILDSINMCKWMGDFLDSTPLSALSIPGTHNSPTCFPALPSVRCQANSPLTQLEIGGVRFLDIRVQVNDAGKGAASDDLELVHAFFPISLRGSIKASTLFNDVYGFLQKHPSETIIMSLKREGRGNGTDAIFSERLRKHYITPQAQYWYTKSAIPFLGKVRGKIVLLRRFGLSERLQEQVRGHGGFGIDATDWADNTTNHSGGAIQIQDFYQVTSTENISKKIQYVCDHFERSGAAMHPVGVTRTAREGPTQPLFLNFLSSNFWKPGCWPDKVAAKMNPAILQFLCEQHEVGGMSHDELGETVTGDGGLGVVVCDWVGGNDDWDLVRTIIAMNSRLLLRLRQQDETSGGSGRSPRAGRGRGIGRRIRGSQR